MRSHGQLGLDADLLDSKHGADYLTQAEHTDIGTGTPHHAAVTLDTNADTLLSLSTQALGLDTQTANRSFAGPTTGSAAVPTFRALVSDDIPSLDHGAKLTGLGDDDHTQYLLATGTRTGATGQIQELTKGISIDVGEASANSVYLLNVANTKALSVYKTSTGHYRATFGSGIIGNGTNFSVNDQTGNVVFYSSVGSINLQVDGVSNSIILTSSNIKLAGGSTNLDSNKIINLADATAATDALNRQTGDGRYILLPASPEQGDVLYYGGATWDRLAHGTAGDALISGGNAANPAWGDHDNLGGLADDDHTQYLLATGARTGASAQVQTFTNGIIVNEGGADSDTRIEGDTMANLLFVDASADKVGICTATPGGLLHIDAQPTAWYADDGTKPTFLFSYSTEQVLNAFMGSGYDMMLANPYSGGSLGGLHFRTGGLTAAFERLTIAKGGNVGVGTTDPKSILHAKGITTQEAGGIDGSLSIAAYNSATAYPDTYRHKISTSHSSAAAGNKWVLALCDGTSTGFVDVLSFAGTAATFGGNVSVGGALALPTVTKAVADSPYTVAAGNYTIRCNAVGGNMTVALPEATGSGRILNIKKIDASAYTVTVDGYSTNTIDGSATQVIYGQYDNMQIQDAAAGVWDIL